MKHIFTDPRDGTIIAEETISQRVSTGDIIVVKGEVYRVVQCAFVKAPEIAGVVKQLWSLEVAILPAAYLEQEGAGHDAN